MTKLISAAAALIAMLNFGLPSGIRAQEPVLGEERRIDPEEAGINGEGRAFRRAMSLYDRGMFGRAREMFSRIAAGGADVEAEGYAVLCALKMGLPGSEQAAVAYIERYPWAEPAADLKFARALRLFDRQDYAGASAELETLSRYSLRRSQMPEYLFKRAYCDFETGQYDRALLRFSELEKHPVSDYTAAARYMLGYILYERQSYGDALKWFEEASSDSRFRAMSLSYAAECRFMLRDYEYLTANADSILSETPEECADRLRRMISEAFLMTGDAREARLYYEQNLKTSAPRTRTDFFYAGSLMYALEDYQGAVDNFSKMGEVNDSIAQVASYKSGYCLIRLRNKVAALDAFRRAASMSFSADVSEDAFYNYAKLSFDLNDDASVFRTYLEKYPDTGRKEMIYGYMAMAALSERDYQGAIDAYDNIDELDPDMKLNYMKANYLRAAELIRGGSWRAAVPCLKAAAYYSDRRSMFNQMSRYWLAESLYRDDKYDEALDLYTRLYNISALYGLDESWLIPYDMAWCHFKMGDYEDAAKRFSEYLSGEKVVWRKDAMLRYADCLFMQRRYGDAGDAYRAVLADYFNADDVYPYYQAALAVGLAGDMDGRISLLENVENASPSSPFYPEAMFELGRSYVAEGRDGDAQKCYRRLVAEGRDSTFVARSMIELGMISRNAGKYDEAVKCYRKVVEEMPYSGYADDALLAIESIYTSLNEPQKYLDYIEKIGKASLKTSDEKEMMIFNAAEQMFLAENHEKALAALQSYLEAYPDGAKAPQAYFYLAESYRSLGKADQACDAYAKVMELGSGSHRELACLSFADLTYSLQRYGDAYGAYSTLEDIASLENNRFAAKVGKMRSAFMDRAYDDASACAEAVLADPMADVDMRREAEYMLAKSCLATSRRDEAFGIFRRLAASPSTAEGAEAVYMLIMDSYDRGDFDDVETRVYSFADAAGGQNYWLAKAFIVLGDSFVERGEFEQAMATFRSVRDGYEPESGEDDVHDNVTMRIGKLEEMMRRTAAGGTE